jgi:hypothetical protein
LEPDLPYIAKTLEFPEEALSQKDVTTDVQKKNGANILAAWQYTSNKKNQFAPLAIVLAKEGTFVNEKLKEDVTRHLAQASTSDGVSRLALGDRMEGYMLSTGGPGGTSILIKLHMLEKRIDLQIKLTIPGQPPLDSGDKTEKYHRLVTTGGKALIDKLVECATQAAESYTGLVGNADKSAR